MKHFLFASTLLLALAPLKPSFASLSSIPVMDELMKKKVEVETKTRSSDDYFIELARSAEVNFFADATQPFGADSAIAESAVGAKQKDTLVALMVGFAQEQRRSQMRYGARTFLFWPEPDVAELAQTLATVNRVQPPANVLSSVDMGRALSRYLQRERGWDGKTADAGIGFHLSDAPVELRQQVQNFALNQVLEKGDIHRVWFLEDFWETLGLQSYPKPDKNFEQLIAFGFDAKNDNRRTYHFLSFQGEGTR